MEIKPSNLVIGMLIVVAIFSPLFLGLSKLTTNYGVTIPERYNDTFTTLSDMSTMDDYTEELKSSVMNEEEPPKTLIGEAIDILGKYFERGYKTLQLVPKTLGVFTGMVNAILDTNINLFGTATLSLRFLAISIVAMGIVFAIVAVLVKWWV